MEQIEVNLNTTRSTLSFLFLFLGMCPNFSPFFSSPTIFHIFLYSLFAITLLGISICIRKKNTLSVCLGDGDTMILEMLEIDILKIEIIF